MSLLDIDLNGLSTSGGILKFAYTNSETAERLNFSDAHLAYRPFLFDDSLGRVNLYFKGKNDNFFVIYFNPNTGNRLRVTPEDQPELSFKPRLDVNMSIQVAAQANVQGTSYTLAVTSQEKMIEQWRYLPLQSVQVAAIINGIGQLALGKLEQTYNQPLDAEPTTITLRT